MKKGFFSDFIADFGSLCLFILVVAILVMVFSLMKTCSHAAIQEISSVSSKEIELNTVMLSYLNTPVDVDGRTMRMSELIAYSVYSSKMREVVVDKSKKILPADMCWSEYISSDCFVIKAYPDLENINTLVAVPGRGFVCVEIYKSTNKCGEVDYGLG